MLRLSSLFSFQRDVGDKWPGSGFAGIGRKQKETCVPIQTNDCFNHFMILLFSGVCLLNPLVGCVVQCVIASSVFPMIFHLAWYKWNQTHWHLAENEIMTPIFSFSTAPAYLAPRVLRVPAGQSCKLWLVAVPLSIENRSRNTITAF